MYLLGLTYKKYKIMVCCKDRFRIFVIFEDLGRYVLLILLIINYCELSNISFRSVKKLL